MKVFELAKEYGMKHSKFIPMINKLGFDIKGFSAVLDDDTVASIKQAIIDDENSKNEKIQNIIDLSKARLLGVAYNPDTKRYVVCTLNVTLDQVKELGGTISEEFGSIYNAKSDVAKAMNKQRILIPNELDK